jgi:hypothetical protein
MLRSFARTFASSGIFLLFPLFVQAQALSFSVGTATAAPGQKSTGYLEVPAGVDAATVIIGSPSTTASTAELGVFSLFPGNDLIMRISITVSRQTPPPNCGPNARPGIMQKIEHAA